MRNPVMTLVAIAAVMLSARAGHPAEDTPSHLLGKTTVTANKTEQDVQKIAISATALSGVLIEDADIRDTLDLVRFAPNVDLMDIRHACGLFARLDITAVTAFLSTGQRPTEERKQLIC